MNASTNKSFMQQIFAELAMGNGKPFVAAMDEDFCWIMIGTTKWSGTYRGKRVVLETLFKPLFAKFADQYKNTAQRFIAEDDLVVSNARGK